MFLFYQFLSGSQLYFRTVVSVKGFNEIWRKGLLFYFDAAWKNKLKPAKIK